ncbi:MAG: DUF4835 family protein [Cyclobacteriaceae bacterium]|nr:DUF4835 family protein [Cyclobacteriaceae bacterium]
MKLKPSYKLILSALFLAWFNQQSFSQDLNCDVVIDAQRIETSETRVFEDMELAFENFLNTRDWSADEINPEERIKCALTITLNEMPSIGTFKATVQIRSARPIFNTSYESIIFNFADRDWSFEYVESLPLNFNENDYSTNLTSMLAFYANIIVGLDYDSFGELSGSSYFQKAQNIVTNASQGGRPGWGALQSTRNRYALVNDITNQQIEDLRIGYYKYHRLGLDVFETNPEECRKQVLEVLESIKAIKNRYPTSIFVISFFDAKSEELVNIFADATIQEKRKAYNLLIELNPIKEDIFKEILN